MTAADDAYTEAQRLIAAAAKSGATTLSLNTTKTRALIRIPPEITALTALTILALSGTGVTNLAPLTTLTAITNLDLNGTGVTNLAPLTTLTALTTLGLSGTTVTDLAPLTTLTALTSLDLSATRITNLAPLTNLTALTNLDLSGSYVAHLAPLANLTALTSLVLRGTYVTELTPLTNLTALTNLDLRGTNVTDLRPLSKLDKLANAPSVLDARDQFFDGLSFNFTPACQDPRIAKIAAIPDPATRARTLFDYLKDLEPPQIVSAVGQAGGHSTASAVGTAIFAPPEPDPLLSSILLNGQLELTPDPPTEAEQHERLKRAMHERLQDKAPDLARAAGNAYPRLASKSRVIAELVARPFNDLDLLSIHLEIEDLSDRARRGVEDGVPYTEDVANALGDVTRLGPGLTLGHPEVDLFLVRLHDAREKPSPQADAVAHAVLSQAIINDPEAHGELSRAMEARLQGLDDPAAKAVAIGAKQYGIVRLIGQLGALIPNFAGKIAVGTTSTFVGGVALKVFGPSVVSFIQKNGPALMDVAATYGPSVLFWFSSVMAAVFLALGIKEEIDKRRRP